MENVDKWEYRPELPLLRMDQLDAYLQRMGEAGWELVQLTIIDPHQLIEWRGQDPASILAIFKRRK